jgi:ribonuclease HI
MIVRSPIPARFRVRRPGIPKSALHPLAPPACAILAVWKFFPVSENFYLFRRILARAYHLPMPGSITLENVLLIYTDGSCQPMPRRGGAGVVFIHVDRFGEWHDSDTLSQPGAYGDNISRMEIQAVIEAIDGAPDQRCFGEVSRVLIRSDSRYVVDHVWSALKYWPESDWRLKGGGPVANADLWREFRRKLIALKKRKTCQIEWTPRKQNKRADKLAKNAAKSPLIKKRSRVIVRRKQTTQETVPYSVPMHGQVMQIRIIESDWLAVHKLNKFRYEVVSGEYAGRASFICASPSMNIRAAHIYEVRVNHETQNPMIEELIGETEKAPKSAS